MIVSKTTKHVISVGPYESLTVEATVTVDTEQDLEPGTSEEALAAYLDDVLTQTITPELEEARRLPTTVPGSHVHHYSLR